MARGIVVAIVAGVAATVSTAGDAPPSLEYVRDKNTVDATVRSILARAGADATVLFVFDAATFDPPPGASEFAEEHQFAPDLPTWTAAIRDAASAPSSKNGPRAVFVAASTSEKPVAVGASKWEALLGGELRAPRWDDKSFRGFEPAHQWASRLLSRVDGSHKALALLTGDVLPEKWIRQPPFRGAAGPLGGEPWRRKLSDVGAYWDAEKVGAAVAAAGARLFVVAPEARFGDFLPLEEIPQAPWASRPRAEPHPGDSKHPGATPSDDGGETPAMSDEAIAAMERQLRAQGVPEPTIRALIDKLRHPSKKSGADDAASKEDKRPGGRFESSTPFWFPDWGQQKFFNADSPSGYGSWPLARAAARTGGAYYLYPFKGAPWADVCPRDSSLIDAMAPELLPAPEFAKLRAGDEALAAMLEAQRIVFEATPWTDGSRGTSQGGASSWCGFDAGGAASPRWRPREKPYDSYLGGQRSVKSWKEEGAKLAHVVAEYDRAVRVLADAQEKLAAGKLAGVVRRSQANLRLCRFWFEMSAFHLDALRIYLTELERFIPPGGDMKNVFITYTPAIRMSDCLDAYDGRVVSAKDEERHGHVEPADAPRGRQDNFLQIEHDDPDYRAKRALACVLLHVDPRLLPRANRMIDAARDVMAHEAKSGWGWVVYYSVADTFVWSPGSRAGGSAPESGHPDSSSPSNPTPHGDPPPPPPPAPSDGGGPDTPK
jgi:hypothetical protein